MQILSLFLLCKLFRSGIDISNGIYNEILLNACYNIDFGLMLRDDNHVNEPHCIILIEQRVYTDFVLSNM
jgi:hypothetical protein